MDKEKQKAYELFLELHGYEVTDSSVGHLQVLMDAMGIFNERNKKYRDLWKRSGWLSHVHHIRHKVARMFSIFWGTDAWKDEDDPLDDAFDNINYTVFFIRAFRDGDERGTLW